jgi:integrase
MTKPRKHHKHLPAKMRFRHGAFYYAGPPWVHLGREYGEALKRYADLVGKRETVYTVKQAIDSYLAHNAVRLRPITLINYQYNAKRLAPVFGHMPLNEVKAAHVYRYMHEYGDVQANRDRALLSAAFSHARHIGAFDGVDPTKGLQFRNAETPRKRYITDTEMSELMKASSLKMACIIRFSYLTGMRQADVLSVKMSDLKADGIYYMANKTGKETLIEWSDELRASVSLANTLWRRFGRVYLFEARGGTAYSGNGVRAMFRRIRAKAGLPDVTFHDLRRKAGSDVELIDAQTLLQHSDGKVTTRHYRAKINRVRPVK